MSIIPQAGVNLPRLTADASEAGRVGFQFGVNARIGRQAYFMPGVLFVRRVPQFINELPDQTLLARKDVGLTGIQLQTLAGYNVINSRAFKFRLHAGPAVTVVTSVDDNDFNLAEADASNTLWGLKAGAGIDVYFVTLDLNYELGFNRLFPNASQARQNVLSLNLGVRLGL